MFVFLVRKSQVEGSVGRPRQRMEDNIKVGLKEIVWDNCQW
jgi:hypothetical protein